MTSNNTCIVAAFDFGTTYSGYAFSFKASPNDVHINEKWYAGSGQLISHKAPTCLLLNAAGEFHSFGYEAEDKYSTLAGEDRHHGWRLFSLFKMTLHKEKVLSHTTNVEDLQGKPHPAMPIFAMSIKYLHKHLLHLLDIRHGWIKESDIKYVITVPAIWGISAKHFMREAAIEAGIDTKRLKLALEPEAAAIWSESLGETSEYQQFMVVDLGGGTVDISVQQKMSDGSLKNIHAPSGGPWGGIHVNKNFLEFIEEVFGENSLDALKSVDMYDYFEMYRDFEMKKRKCTLDSNDDILFRIPIALQDASKQHSDQPLSDRLSSLKYGTKVYVRGKDKLGVNAAVMKSWFSEPVSKITEHVQHIIQEERMRDVGLIILVGGFAESPYVQNQIQQALTNKRMIVPGDAGLAVLKGAVVFGHKPDIISSRIMNYTFGIGIYNIFDEKKHPVEKKVFKNGKWRIRNVFKIFVRVNEDVPVDSEVTCKTWPLTRTTTIQIYRTKVRDPVYTTDPGCELLGTVLLENDKDIVLGEQELTTTFLFGDTELLIKSKNLRTGKVETLTLDLNNN